MPAKKWFTPPHSVATQLRAQPRHQIMLAQDDYALRPTQFKPLSNLLRHAIRVFHVNLSSRFVFWDGVNGQHGFKERVQSE